MLADNTPVLVHNCGGPVRLTDDVIDTHILPRHGPGSPAWGAKFSDAIDPDDYEDFANKAARGALVPSKVDPAIKNHVHDYDFGPGRIIGENGETGARVWVDPDGNVTSMYPR